MPLRPYQQQTIDQLLHLLRSANRIPHCVFGPTGSGKSHIIREFIAQAHVPTIVYTHRKLLFQQIRDHLAAANVVVGLRASGHEKRLLEDVQVAMIQSETKRVSVGQHSMHNAKLVIVDEAHEACQGGILALSEKHRSQGSLVVGFTATPLDINHFYKRIIVSVTYDECYRNGWLLPCNIYEVQRPDNRWIKKVPVGEVLIEGKYRVQFRQQIVGRVLDSYRRLNPLGVPTLLFAPDRPSATWFAQQFCQDGIPAASIDGQKCWVDDQDFHGTRKREEIIQRLKDRDLKVVCNRFVLTTGVDIPEVGHGICATPYGSVKVFRQAFGRILRPHPTLNSVSWIDHGGNPFRLGDPRVDIDWSQTPTDLVIQDTIKERMKSKPESEPIICPNCHQMRFPGENQEYNLVCPSCGWAAKGRVHNVLQVDGTLLRKTGYYYPKRRVANPSLCDKWKKCFYRCRTSGRTIAQAKALFKYENYGQEPDPNWPLMPKRIVDLRRKIKDIPKEHLVEDLK